MLYNTCMSFINGYKVAFFVTFISKTQINYTLTCKSNEINYFID